MKKNVTKTQALLTAIGMMIGSGIFFRADNIVTSTQGNAWIGIFGWIFIGSTLIFAGLTIASIASRTKQNGGFIGYIEEHFGKRWAFIVGWYQIVVYIPIMIAVLSSVLVDYALQLFGFKLTDIQSFIAWICVVIFVVTWNILSTRIAAMVSSSATIIKIIPLLLIAILGLTIGDVSNISHETVSSLVSSTPKGTLALFFAPLLSMAFAFDGWITVGSLTVDMKNPQKDLPKVFVWSVIITTAVYTLYFAGVNATLNAGVIAEMKDAHVGEVAKMLLGENFGPTFVLTCVVVSVLGTLNGMIMAGGRYVSKMCEEDLLPKSEKIKKVSRFATPANALILVFCVAFVYQILFYLKFIGVEWLQAIAIDDIPMVLNSILYIMLFCAVMKMAKTWKLSIFRGVIAPLIAIFGQGLIVVAFFINADNIMIPIIYMIVSFVIIAMGFVVCSKQVKKLSK